MPKQPVPKPTPFYAIAARKRHAAERAEARAAALRAEAAELDKKAAKA